MDIGDFTVSDFGLEFARDKQESRSKESRSQDRNKRAPITTDAGAWADNPDELDYPGIDTPSENPDVLPKDLMHPAKTDVAADARGETGGTGVDQIPSGEAERSRLAATDISLAPGEAFEGVATVSRGDELGGNVLGKGERSPTYEPVEPPESALELQGEGDFSDLYD